MPSTVQVRVEGLPLWVDPKQALAAVAWERVSDAVIGHADRATAADIAARTRGVSIDGRPLTVHIRPSLKRGDIRAGRLRDARARRDTSPGFRVKGTRCDEEGRWSLTPEDLALAMAKPWAGARIVDLTCGAGGNTIGFARAGCSVTAIERDPMRLADARHNARRYGVADSVTFVHGDALALVETIDADLFFVDPPWGTEWNRHSTTMHDLPLLAQLIQQYDGAASLLAKVPPSFNTKTTPGALPKAWFGSAAGDRYRLKFVTLQWDETVSPSARASARPPVSPPPNR